MKSVWPRCDDFMILGWKNIKSKKKNVFFNIEIFQSGNFMWNISYS